MRKLARDLAGQLRDWLDRTAERVLDRLGSVHPKLGLAEQLRAAFEGHQRDREVPEADRPERDQERKREAPENMAARLRGGGGRG